VSIFIILAMFVLLYALLIRPQRQKQRAQQHMLSKIASGDEVLTVGGIYGIVQELDDDDDLVVEIAEGIHVRMARRAVASVIPAEEQDDAGEAHDEDDVVDAEAEEIDAEAEEVEGLVTVPDDEASIEATRKRLFRR
jgi:preprotein translocase subunit YajC